MAKVTPKLGDVKAASTLAGINKLKNLSVSTSIVEETAEIIIPPSVASIQSDDVLIGIQTDAAVKVDLMGSDLNPPPFVITVVVPPKPAGCESGLPHEGEDRPSTFYNGQPVQRTKVDVAALGMRHNDEDGPGEPTIGSFQKCIGAWREFLYHQAGCNEKKNADFPGDDEEMAKANGGEKWSNESIAPLTGAEEAAGPSGFSSMILVTVSVFGVICTSTKKTPKGHFRYPHCRVPVANQCAESARWPTRAAWRLLLVAIMMIVCPAAVAGQGDAALEVMIGDSYCHVIEDGMCVTDGGGNYGRPEECTVRVDRVGTLTATEFDIEDPYSIYDFIVFNDHITIDGTQYGGGTGPDNIAVAAGSTFTWTSDNVMSHDSTGAGWIICFADLPTTAPTARPTADGETYGPTLSPPATTDPCLAFQCSRDCQPIRGIARHISDGDTVTGDTNFPGTSEMGGQSFDHTYEFHLDDASTVVFNTCGSNYDTWLRVYDNAGNELESCDDCGDCGARTVLTTSLLAAGDYVPLVEGFSSYSGPYILTMATDGAADHGAVDLPILFMCGWDTEASVCQHEFDALLETTPDDCSHDAPTTSPTPAPTPAPTTASPHGYRFVCANNAELVAAVERYIDTGQADSQRTPIGEWGVSQVTDMSAVFFLKDDFNEDIAAWNVARVTTMASMFYSAGSFDGDLSAWDVARVTTTNGMFRDASSFNSDLSGWNVGRVRSMGHMFSFAMRFNSDLSAWSVGRVTTMDCMFYQAYGFNGDLSAWDVGRVANMENMFKYAERFRSDLSAWDVRQVIIMDGMFSRTNFFTSDLTSWDVGDGRIAHADMFQYSSFRRHPECSPQAFYADIFPNAEQPQPPCPLTPTASPTSSPTAGAFALKTAVTAGGGGGTCGEGYINALQANISAKLMAVAKRTPQTDSSWHDINTTVIMEGIDTDRCNFSDVFDHAQYSTDGNNDPQISFHVAVEYLSGNTATLGEDPFFTDKGRILLSLNRRGEYRVKLQATTARPGSAVLNLTSVQLRIGYPDTTDPETGRDRNCSGHGVVSEDLDHDGVAQVQNGDYECSCSDSWTGVDCETFTPASAAAASAADDSGAAVGAILGTIVFLMLAALIAFRVQLYRLKHRPVNLTAMQQRVMQDLGLAAATNFGQDEVGITLVFDRCPVDAATAELSDPFKHELVAVLARATPQLKVALRTVKLTSAGPKSIQVLVVVPKSSGLNDGLVTTVVETLARKAAKGRMATAAGFSLVDASVAVPQRVPREIPRSALTRISVLSEGAFGDVHKYQLEERGSSLAFFVAVKSIKAGAAGAEEARSDLMREATLGALLVHRNVIALVGICTAPRDVPALLLLAFCPEGDLETLCLNAAPCSDSSPRLVTSKGRSSKSSRGSVQTSRVLSASTSDQAIPMTVSERLTYCAEVLQGLQYISTRRIVHRDVAARNVLLDSTMTCKISDFGIATALAVDGKEYIRSTEQLAIRWCSIEVIKEGKYSSQSDVWAFGVLAYEVFACGVLPYSDQFDNLTEVSNFIKEGGKLNRPSPEACPQEVFDELMVPCFAADPADRPAFGELYDVAVTHGAEEDEEAMAERAARRRQVRGGSTHSRHNVADPADRTLLGPTIFHLEATLVPRTIAAIPSIKGHSRQQRFDSLGDPADATIWHMVHAYAKPLSKDTVCPRAGTMGCAYVDTLVHEDDVGQANALLSYSWGYVVREVAGALTAWAARTERDPKRTRIWICSLCLNQHSMSREAASPEDLAAEFGDRVVAIGRILPMLEPWEDPGYVKRAWCLFELYTAIQKRSDVDIDIILSPKQAQSFRDRITVDGNDARAIDDALSGIKSENATASVQVDLEAIRALIRKYSGGFGTLNDKVKQYLRRWFVSQGGVKVVARTRRNNPQRAAKNRVAPVKIYVASTTATAAAAVAPVPSMAEGFSAVSRSMSSQVAGVEGEAIRAGTLVEVHLTRERTKVQRAIEKRLDSSLERLANTSLKRPTNDKQHNG